MTTLCSRVSLITDDCTRRPGAAPCYNSWRPSVSRCHRANTEQFSARYQDVNITTGIQASPQDDTLRSKFLEHLCAFMITRFIYLITYCCAVFTRAFRVLYRVFLIRPICSVRWPSSHLTLCYLNLFDDDDDEQVYPNLTPNNSSMGR